MNNIFVIIWINNLSQNPDNESTENSVLQCLALKKGTSTEQDFWVALKIGTSTERNSVTLPTLIGGGFEARFQGRPVL